jgi:endonuclease YncB( thermonuclease family)
MITWMLRRAKRRLFWKGRRLLIAAALPLVAGASFVQVSDFLPDMPGLSGVMPAFAQSGVARTVEGRVTRVRDIDTIVVAGTAVRLNGVDGPELDTQAGREARAWLVRQIDGRQVRCDLDGSRTHDRFVGICYLEGQDIGAMAISAGHALDCPRFSGGRYRHLETPASRSRLSRASYCR